MFSASRRGGSGAGVHAHKGGQGVDGRAEGISHPPVPAANPHRLISKEELLNTVWGDAAVTEGSLTRCIWLLRSRLGDDIHEPRYIATVATVGYRFVCKVEVSEDDLGNLEATGTVPAKDKSHPRWKTRGAIPWLLVVPLICLAAYVFYFRNRSQPATSLFLRAAHQLCWGWDLSFVFS